MTLHEKELIEQLSAGEEQAFEILIETFQDRVLNTCYRFVHDRQHAEDVAQEVFIEVLQSIDRFRGESQLSTWIYRVATTKSLDFKRKQNRKKRLGHLKRMLGFQNEDGQASCEPEDPQQPTENLEQEERLAILQRALATLPENQRIALTLNQFETLPYTEVAKIMGTTVSAVESLLHRGKKNLRKQLTRYYDDILE